MSIEQFIEKVVANCEQRGLKKYQITYRESESDSLSVFEQEVSENESSDNLTLQISVIVNGKLGKMTTEKFVEEDIHMLVKQAVMNAEIVENEDEVFFHDGSGDYAKVKPYAPLMDKLEKLDKVAFLKELEAKAYALDKRVNKVVATQYGFSRGKLIMRNSLGLNLSKEEFGAYAYVYLSATDGKLNKTASEVVSFDKESDFNAESLAKKAVEKAVAKLGSVEVKSQKTRVVFENVTFANLLSSILGIFSAYEIDKGYSKLKINSIGKKIASEKFTLIDNPHLEKGFATASFDGDGFPTQNKKIVEKGVLQHLFFNLSMAHKYSTKSTGNGTGGLGTKPFNLYVEKGNITKVELLKVLDSGIYIDRLNGIHAGVDLVSGDFSLGAEGFVVEKGMISNPVNQFTISGNLYCLLEDVEEVADDLEFKSRSIGSPSVLVKNVTIASS
ncbi:MAG: TldD/PmbA family protein [Alphaproteobacteria bacterium]|nr:TldD/PmbA family protein [Alphaproteobacteria bacterium]